MRETEVRRSLTLTPWVGGVPEGSRWRWMAGAGGAPREVRV
ncbi:hypothetical protein BLAT2472_70089 [Burkholderia latens]